MTNYQSNIEYLMVDLFCGAGGVTTGAEEAGNCLVIAAVNHDPICIKSHWANHPHVKHFEEDIRSLELSGLIAHVQTMRILHPDAKLVLWASLECTNFSKAKGGKPRDADSRTLADHLDRYIIALEPDEIRIENVKEFQSWGPLDDRGKPISRKAGCDFVRWCNMVNGLGYVNDWRDMNAANFGEATSRDRLFGLFVRPGMPFTWPEPTHAKNGKGGLLPWVACGPCLDLEDEGKSIFDRKIPLVDNTIMRLIGGGVKYIAKLKMSEFILKYNSYRDGNWDHCSSSVDEPMGVITTQNRLYVANMVLLQNQNGGGPSGKTRSVDEPAQTIMTQTNKNLVFLSKYYGTGHNCESIDEPSGTIRTKDGVAIVHLDQWLDKAYSGHANHGSLDQPAGTVMSNDKFSVVSAEGWIDRSFSSGGGKTNDLNGPAGSITTVPKMSVVQPLHILINTSFSNHGSSIDDPAPTITANRKQFYLFNPQYGGATWDIERPFFTIIARQDKAPAYLIETEEGAIGIEVYETDSEAMRMLKFFMASYGILDIKMRMVRVKELARIQGFPEDYILEGSQEAQKKAIGNSVCPKVVKAWFKASSARTGVYSHQQVA
jgi:DNA (cytosine-5)-methyltransferase 1